MTLQKLYVITMDYDSCKQSYLRNAEDREDAFCAHKDYNKEYGLCDVISII